MEANEPIGDIALAVDGAAAPPDAVDRLAELIATGGPVMYVLGVLSVVALAVILLKAAQFAWLRFGDDRAAFDALVAWRSGDAPRCAETLSGRRGPVTRALAHVVEWIGHGELDRHGLEEEAARIAAGEVARLRAGMRSLELIATLAPLLGLLGTVLGMIEAFQALEAAGSRVDPAILSGGIWVALLTTAAGLVVAIPAAAAHSLFEGAIETIVQALEDSLTQLLTLPAQRQAVAPVASPPRLAAGRTG